MEIIELLKSNNLDDIVLGLILADEEKYQVPWEPNSRGGIDDLFEHGGNKDSSYYIIIIAGLIYEINRQYILKILNIEEYVNWLKKSKHEIHYTDNSIEI